MGIQRSLTSHRWRMTSVVVVSVLVIGTSGLMFGTAGAATRSSKHKHHAAADTPSTASFVFSATVDGSSVASATVTGSGQADFTNDEVAATIDLPASLAQLLPGGSNAPETVNAVLASGTIYLEAPQVQSLLGAPWLSVALPSTTASALPGIFSKVASALGDVNVIVTYAKSKSATVTSLGTAMVDGVTATGSQIVASLSGKSETNLSATVWADSSNRLVRGRVSSDTTGSGGTYGLTGSADFSDYGAPVSITIPQSSEVRAIPFSVVKGFLGHSLGASVVKGKTTRR